MLGSAFFFSSEAEDRRRPNKLFSTISRDICDRDPFFRASISNAVEEERALASAPMRRQFNGLILRPARTASPRRTHPLTIVIDALDEGCNDDLLQILEKSAALVPSEFRFFITTRSDATIITRLRNMEHISLKEINMSRQDVEVFVHHRLNEIAHHHDLENWLDDTLITRFNQHAEGHFLWSATVCKHVDNCDSPKEEMDSLLNNKDLLDRRVTEKMNKLYTEILSKCPWLSPRFSRRYQSCLGAVVALKRPLSISSIEKLLNDTNAGTAFRPLSSLLMGALSKDQPIQIAHSSLRDFVTHCDRENPAVARFAISEVEHSRHLALYCIVALNNGLPELRTSVAWIFQDKRAAGNIPNLIDGAIAQHVWYACEHWVDHIRDIESASDELRGALAYFMEECIFIWVAVGAMRGKYFSIGNLYTWLKVFLIFIFITTFH